MTTTPRTRIEQIYQAALRAVDPVAATRAAFRERDGEIEVDGLQIGHFGRVLVVAIGKAAHGMATGACQALGAHIDAGMVLAKEGPGEICPPGFTCFEASHPVPDERGVAATRAILAAVRGLGPNDLLVALISGGGSALLESPVPPLTLADIQEVTRLLLRAGAPIDDLNAVRSVLSEVKGGGLRRAAGEATVASLILSDVLGNDPRVIASGPTIPATPDPDVALAVLRQYGLLDAVPEPVRHMIEDRPTSKQATIHPARDVWRIIADNGTLIDAAAEAADGSSLGRRVVWRDKEGEASDLAREFVAICEQMPAGVDCVLGGGEATVTVRGDGVGGRNTEFALAAAIELDRSGSSWSVASLASDGDDATTGAAGAIADAATIERARAAGIDPARELAHNNSAHVFAVAGGLVTPGLTGTNVNDLYIAIRG